MEKEIYDEKNGLWYTLAEDGCYYPNLELPKEKSVWVGKYGLMRKNFLRGHRTSLYISLYLSGKLNQHLLEVNQRAQKYVEDVVAYLAKFNGIDEDMKVCSQMEWVGRMNNYHACAEEAVLREVVYV
ncbi:TnpV protein [Chakrabartyella piscis]|uniref:TnpV protein n=1 Tax=Chakrabartyella piscis TaxID=2918914 RepID=UPI002958833E|nr:TnpV protein [Chakrabartyella piscis]